MRRAHIVIASTVVGLAAVLGYRPNMTQNATSLASASASTGSTGAKSTASSAATTDSTTTTTAAQTTATPAAADTTTAATTTATPAPTKPKPAPAPASKTYTGSNETISEYGRQYGEIQAKVTITAGKITNVSLGNVNLYDGHSSQIANYAVPRLMQQTINAGSAQIDGVSGATYTSQAYEASVQAALDQAGV